MPGLRVPLPPPMGWRAPSISGVSVGSARRLHVGGAVSPSQAAAIRVELLTESFTDSLTRYVVATREELRDTVMSTALELHARIVMRTPVKTGRAQNSWHVIEAGAQGDSYRYSDNEGRSFDGGLTGIAFGELEAGVGSNVVYMLPLEGGWSRQAPAGMVAVSLLELQGALDRKTDEALGVHWDAPVAPTPSRKAPPPSSAGGLTWRTFVAGRMGAAMRETGSHGAAMKKLGAEWRARKLP